LAVTVADSENPPPVPVTEIVYALAGVLDVLVIVRTRLSVDPGVNVEVVVG